MGGQDMTRISYTVLGARTGAETKGGMDGAGIVPQGTNQTPCRTAKQGRLQNHRLQRPNTGPCSSTWHCRMVRSECSLGRIGWAQCATWAMRGAYNALARLEAKGMLPPANDHSQTLASQYARYGH